MMNEQKYRSILKLSPLMSLLKALSSRQSLRHLLPLLPLSDLFRNTPVGVEIKGISFNVELHTLKVAMLGRRVIFQPPKADAKARISAATIIIGHGPVSRLGPRHSTGD